MQYGLILKRAWSIAWRNKNLWWLGLFAGVGAGANFNSSSSNFNSSDFTGSGSSGAPFDYAQVWSEVVRFMPIIIAVTVLFVLLWLAMLIVQVAARGGLVDQAAAADDGQRPLAMRGWGAGFHRWWPLALMMAILALPGLIALLIIVIVAFTLIALPLYGGQTPALGSIVSVIFIAAGIGLVLLPVSILLSVLQLLAEREVMLAEMGPWESLKASWRLVRTRFKDVALFWLIMVGIGIAFGLVLVVAILICVAVGVGLVIAAGVASARAIVPMVLVGILAFGVLALVMTVVSAAYATFHSTAWTLFWRRLTGRIADAMPAPAPVPAYAAAPAPAPAPPAGYPSAYPPPPAGSGPAQPAYPPVTGTGPAPQAPPMAPYPPAPPQAPTPPVAPPAPPVAPAPDAAAPVAPAPAPPAPVAPDTAAPEGSDDAAPSEPQS